MTMNKYLFEDWLRNRLDDLAPEELDRVCAFYRSAIDERMDEGMTEEEAVHDLGEPETLLTEIRASLPENAFVHSAQEEDTRWTKARKKRRSLLLLICAGLAGLTVTAVLLSGLSSFFINVRHTVTPVEVWPETQAPIEAPVIEIQDWSQGYPGYEDWFVEPWEIIHFEIAADLGMVTLEPSPDDLIHIWTNDPGMLSLTQRGTSLYAEQTGGDLIVQIPAVCQNQLIVTVGADLGDIRLYDCRPRSLYVRADLGSITLSHVSVEDRLRLETDVGSISGTIADTRESYTVFASAHMTSDTLTEGPDTGSKTLEVICDVGKVDVEFEHFGLTVE